MFENSFKNKFLLISALAFLVVGSLVYPIVKNQMDNFIVAEAKADFQQDVQDKASAAFQLDLPLSLKDSSKTTDFVKSVASETKATDLKLFDSNGTVLYSSSPAEVGQVFNSDQNLSNAIGGATISETPDLKNLTMTELATIKSASGDVRGVVSAKIVLPASLSEVNKFALELDGIIGALSLAFVLGIYFVFASAEADMAEKDHSLVDKSKAFEEEKQLDDAIMSSMAESLTVINKDGQIMLFNPQTELLTGYKASEVEYRLYRKVLVFCDKDGKEIAKNPINEALKTAKPAQISIKDGYFLKNLKKELIPVAISLAPILDQAKNSQGVVVTIDDISTEVELDKVKDEFVYVVAHELGNPIFALDGYLSILQEQSKKANTETKDIIKSARSINQQLSELVNDLLEVVRNEQGTLKFELEPIDVSEITETVIQNSQFKAKSKNITLKYKKIAFAKTNGSAQKIKEVITNLVDNAIKYTPKGGTVEVWQDQKDGQVTTHVKDNGFGIAKADQEKLFEKFYRVRNKKTNEISGTGLGLFICRQIVEKCGGRIWAESAEDQGSTFSFALKVAK